MISEDDERQGLQYSRADTQLVCTSDPLPEIRDEQENRKPSPDLRRNLDPFHGFSPNFRARRVDKRLATEPNRRRERHRETAAHRAFPVFR
jgi:hypothetical protein